MKPYKSLFKEQEEDVKLEDVKLIDKLLVWFKNNPYPQDHNGLHKFADSIGIEADVLETYVYAILSCFICGGNFNSSGMSEEDFSSEEIKMGIKVEMEHLDKNNKNPVVQRICSIMAKRIALDHLIESNVYYTELKKMESSFEK